MVIGLRCSQDLAQLQFDEWVGSYGLWDAPCVRPYSELLGGERGASDPEPSLRGYTAGRKNVPSTPRHLAEIRVRIRSFRGASTMHPASSSHAHIMLGAAESFTPECQADRHSTAVERDFVGQVLVVGAKKISSLGKIHTHMLQDAVQTVTRKLLRSTVLCGKMHKKSCAPSCLSVMRNARLPPPRTFGNQGTAAHAP